MADWISAPPRPPFMCKGCNRPTFDDPCGICGHDHHLDPMRKLRADLEAGVAAFKAQQAALREAWHILHDLRNAVALWDGLGAALDRADRWCADNVPGEVEVAGGEG